MFAGGRQGRFEEGHVRQIGTRVRLNQWGFGGRRDRLDRLLVPWRLHRTLDGDAWTQDPAGDHLAAAAEEFRKTLTQTTVQAEEEYRVHECVNVRDM